MALRRAVRRTVCLAALVMAAVALPAVIVRFNRGGTNPGTAPDTQRAEGERPVDDPRTEPGGEPPHESVIGPPWKPAEENFVLPTGAKARTVYHFNRNALSAACLIDDALLAVTDSGNLLRFDLKDLRLQQEVRPDAAVVRLTASKGVGVLAACADGRVFRVDPKTLARTELTRLPSPPQWMGGFRDAAKQQDGILAVSGGPQEIELRRFGFGPADSETCKLSGVRFPHRGVSAFFLDGKSRLWLGNDAGEWGGWCGCLDLNAGKSGRIETLEGRWHGVYGFVELSDGQVWVYGGMMHLGLCTGFIARVDRGKLERLGDFSDSGKEPGESNAPPMRPRYPITHVIADPKGDGLLIFSYRDLFRVDTKLTNWRHLGSIELRYHPGRPDAVGSFPALRTVHAAQDKSADLICTTACDGLLRIRDGRVTQYTVPGQIGDDRINTILPASGATLLGGEGLWNYTGGTWQATSLFPPGRPAAHESWYEQSLMLDPDRQPVALCRSTSTPGTAALTRLKDGNVEVLARQEANFCARGGFATPDGGYWCAEREELLRLVDGKWQRAGTAPENSLWGLRAVGGSKPPWVLHCKTRLYRLTPGTGAQGAALVPVPLPAGLGTVRDTLAVEGGQILLACFAGLRLMDEKSGQVSECPFAPAGGDVWALGRDGRGRIWLAGRGLWMVDARGTVHDLSELNRYGAVSYAIGADGADPAGVLVALDRRGVLAVRVEDAGH